MNTTTHFCISCAREFHPRSPEALLCPDCGGPPEAPSPESVSGGGTRLDAEAPPPDSGRRALLTPQPAQPQPSQTTLKPSLGRALAEGEVPAEWQPGDELLDTYIVRSLLGQGGMGKVYRVHHNSWHIDLAVKSPRPEFFQTQEQKDLFVSEAETWVNLGLHPHIVSCYYVRTIDGIPRVFAELVEGGSLEDWIRQGKITHIEQALDIAIQFAWGLAYAHEQGLVHRDVKPANVLMTPEGTVKVTDFGLAKAGKGLTPAYASPEQAEAQLKDVKLTPQSDIWSWGLSVLELFAGRPFWVRADMPGYAWGQVASQAVDHYISGGLEDPAIAEIPPELIEVLKSCFSTNPSARPSINQIVNLLNDIYSMVTGKSHPRSRPKSANLRADSMNNKALSLLDLGQDKEADKIWKAALDVDPQHAPSIYNYGLQQWRRGQLSDEELVDQLQGICNARPEDWFSHIILAQVHLERNDPGSAQTSLVRMIKKHPGNQEIVSLWNIIEKRMNGGIAPIRKLSGHHPWSSISSVQFSPDGRQAVSASGMSMEKDHTVRLWDLASGNCLQVLSGHSSPVNQASFSPDGRIILSGSGDLFHTTEDKPYDPTLLAWDARLGKLIFRFPANTGQVSAVCVTSDSRYALAACNLINLGLRQGDFQIQVWDLARQRCIQRMRGHSRRVNCLAISSELQLVVSGSDDKTIYLWDFNSGQILRRFLGHAGEVTAVDLDSANRRVLSGSKDRTVRLWDLDSAKCIMTLHGCVQAVNSVRFCPNGQMAIAASEDGSVRIWDLTSGQCLRSIRKSKNGIKSVDWSPDGKRILFTQSAELEYWSLGKTTIDSYHAPWMLSSIIQSETAGQAQGEFDQLMERAEQSLNNADALEAMDLIQKARKVEGFERDAKAFDLWCKLYRKLPVIGCRGAWEVKKISGLSNTANQVGKMAQIDTVNAICLSPDNLYFFACIVDTIKMIEIASGRCIKVFKDKNGMVTTIRPSPDGRYLITGGAFVQTWEIEAGKSVLTLSLMEKELGSKDACFSPDGNFILTTFKTQAQSGLCIWNHTNGKLIRRINLFGENSVGFGKSSRNSSIEKIGFSQDGRTFYAISSDGSLSTWDFATGRSLQVIEAHQDWVLSAELTHDSRYAATSGAGTDPPIRVWDLEKSRNIRTFSEHTSVINSLLFIGNEKFLAAAGHDKKIRIWDISSGKLVQVLEGHTDLISSLCASQDGSFLVSAGKDRTVRIWAIDWELRPQQLSDWDEGARGYLNNFLTLHTPYAKRLPEDLSLNDDRLIHCLTRRGNPTWQEEDFQRLLHTLECAGYGWLRPEGVRRKLEEMARERGWTPQ